MNALFPKPKYFPRWKQLIFDRTQTADPMIYQTVFF